MVVHYSVRIQLMSMALFLIVLLHYCVRVQGYTRVRRLFGRYLLFYYVYFVVGDAIVLLGLGIELEGSELLERSLTGWMLGCGVDDRGLRAVLAALALVQIHGGAVDVHRFEALGQGLVVQERRPRTFALVAAVEHFAPQIEDLCLHLLLELVLALLELLLDLFIRIPNNLVKLCIQLIE